MTILFWIILSTFLISLISLVGTLTLFLKEKLLDKILLYLVALSAGTLLGGAFLHLLPEAIIKVGISSISNLFFYLLLGFCTFFVLEQFMNFHHHHSMRHKKNLHNKKPLSYLILISDLIHNFIDGLVIAGSFIISFPVGLTTVFAIALHEIPQELGDFGILVYGGFKRKRALILNYISSISVILGGVFGFYITSLIEGSAVLLLPFAAGNFIYIASSDLIPEIKKEKRIKISLAYFLVFLIGIGIMSLVKLL